MGNIEIRRGDLDDLQVYGEIPIAFLVETVYQVKDNGLRGIELFEERVNKPYVRDHDAARGEGPTRWLKRFDMSNWGIFRAFEDDIAVGGAIVAPGAHIGDLDKRFAQLFDIRLVPEKRRGGVGALLFNAVIEYIRGQGCEYLKIETQNTNVPGCKFYAEQGCYLGSIDRHAYIGYPELEHEVKLVWYYAL
ncbi:MAG: GNAT family N-acetyltransferase [Dehalococcoidales bacterium]|nr:GNAT family N-acetyltransferase [Dehalococcoidales bacterium]